MIPLQSNFESDPIRPIAFVGYWQCRSLWTCAQRCISMNILYSSNVKFWSEKNFFQIGKTLSTWVSTWVSILRLEQVASSLICKIIQLIIDKSFRWEKNRKILLVVRFDCQTLIRSAVRWQANHHWPLVWTSELPLVWKQAGRADQRQCKRKSLEAGKANK